MKIKNGIQKYLLKTSIFILIGIFFYIIFNFIFYPQRLCSGELKTKLIWIDDSSKERRVLQDDNKPFSIAFFYKRGAVYLDDERFPLYKEFNDKDNFASKTEVGYIGQYSQYGLIDQKSIFHFKFNELTSMLYTENIADGVHLLDGKFGKDSLKAEFVGSCSRKIF